MDGFVWFGSGSLDELDEYTDGVFLLLFLLSCGVHPYLQTTVLFIALVGALLDRQHTLVLCCGVLSLFHHGGESLERCVACELALVGT